MESCGIISSGWCGLGSFLGAHGLSPRLLLMQARPAHAGESGERARPWAAGASEGVRGWPGVSTVKLAWLNLALASGFSTSLRVRATALGSGRRHGACVRPCCIGRGKCGRGECNPVASPWEKGRSAGCILQTGWGRSLGSLLGGLRLDERNGASLATERSGHVRWEESPAVSYWTGACCGHLADSLLALRSCLTACSQDLQDQEDPCQEGAPEPANPPVDPP